MVKKGDTLVEVALAIGIFSMVAIAVVAVMVGGTSNAQNALETTLAREEIDTQAEALRFIHASYLADEETGENKNPYTQLWKKITENAYTPTNTDNDKTFLQYNPTSCQDIYKEAATTTDPSALRKGFIINPYALSDLTVDKDNAYVPYNKDKFYPAATYPRLIYNDNQASNTDALIQQPDNTDITDLYRIEGLYVLAVKDPETTNIIVDASGAKKTSAYYDFYIRTCWYGAGSDSPSAISTVIRLYDPDSIASGVENKDEGIKEIKGEIKYKDGKSPKPFHTQTCESFPCKLEDQDEIFKDYSIPDGQQFKEWRTNAFWWLGKTISPGGEVEKPITLYAIWEPLDPTPDPTPDPPAPSSPVAINGLTKEGCRESTKNEDLSVYDPRDNKTYTVRWINGKCWMTSDLKNSNAKHHFLGYVVKPQLMTKNIAGGKEWAYLGPAYYWVSESDDYYYSYLAAAATGASKNFICPENWHIPNSSELEGLNGPTNMELFKPSKRSYVEAYGYISKPSGNTSFYWTQGGVYFVENSSFVSVDKLDWDFKDVTRWRLFPIRCVRND